MKRQWLSRSDASDLIVIFGGWALGACPFSTLTGGGDVLFVDDFTRLDDPLPELARYGRVDLIAFSFGVAAAAHWMSVTGFVPTRLTAVSGTLSPADAENGIAPDVIRATADKLNENSFARFCRRAGLVGPAPMMDIAAARDELYAVMERGAAPDCRFDRIWIPDQDRIVPTNAQKAAWHGQADAVRHIPGPHVPFRTGQSWADWIV